MNLKLIKNTEEIVGEVVGDDCPRARIEELARRLRTIFPLTKVRAGDRGLTVLADEADGFTVTLEFIDEAFAVSFGPGLIEFDDFEAAFKHVVLACSEEAQLTVVKRGNQARRWHLDVRRSDGDWQRALSGGYNLFGNLGFGRKDETVTLRNGRTLPLTSAHAYGMKTKRSSDPAA